MSRQKGTRWLLWCLSALCLLSLGLPFAYRWASGAWLQSRGMAHPALAGALSAQGQAVPLAYALYRDRFAPSTALETAADAGQVGQELQKTLDALDGAGALPEPAARRARWLLEQQPAETTRKQENGFTSATWLVAASADETVYALTATWQEKTGAVVEWTVSSAAISTDLGPCLAAYRRYLGLDALTDWEELPGEGKTSAWSAAGQLVLGCRCEGDRFTLEARSQPEKPQPPTEAAP